MKFRSIFALLVLAVVAPSLAMAQTPDQERAKKSDQIMATMRQVDLLNQILPILLTKKQILDLLPSLETCQENTKKVQAQEAKDLMAEEKALEDSVTGAVDRGEMPTKELLAHEAKLLQAFTLRRRIAAGENIKTVYDACVKILNSGQMKVLANSLDPKYLDDTMHRDKMSDEELSKIFIREILLDPLAYGLLVKMSK